MSGAGGPGRGTPTDWVSGERVFGPPVGTFDVDWLVPAVVEQAGVDVAVARAALQQVWSDHRTGAAPTGDDDAHRVARQVLDAAVEQYRVEKHQVELKPPA
jgi:hypothetical protein